MVHGTVSRFREVPHGALSLEWSRVVGNGALHREVTGWANREGHGGLH